MKILYASDLHLEFKPELPELPPRETYDVVALVGDIGLNTRGAAWALDFFPKDVPILYVPGNHEYYGYRIDLVNERMEELDEKNSNFYFLNDRAVEIDGVKFVGSILWSSLKYEGMPAGPLGEWEIDNTIADFRKIYVTEKVRFTTAKMKEMNLECRNFLAGHTNFCDTKKVFLTHFLPSVECTHPKWKGEAYSKLNHYFSSDTDYLIDPKFQDLWIYGHSHDGMDFVHSKGVRIISNQKGYPGENPENFSWKIYEI